MSTAFLSRFDPLKSELAYVGVVALALVLSVFMGMSLVWPGDELGAYLHREGPSVTSGPDTTSGQPVALSVPGSPGPQGRQGAHAVDPASSLGTAAPALIPVASRPQRR